MSMHTHTASSYHTVAAIKADQNIDPTLASALGHRALELGNQLQTTLDINELISLFADEITQNVTYHSLHYLNQANNIDIPIGSRSAHKCSYQLSIENNCLGELILYTKNPLKENELVVLENLICALIYPLRNALLYQNALRSALIDPLTGVNNRAGMDTAIKREIDLAYRHNTPMCVMLLDIDHFKKVNDNFGHASGDFVLQAVAQCINETIRGSDVIFRFGGEEFLMILSCTEIEGAELLAERIRQRVEQLSFSTQKELRITASLGISTLGHQDTITTLFERADEALYTAKQTGRNQVISNTHKEHCTS